MADDGDAPVVLTPENINAELDTSGQVKILKPMIGTTMARFLNQYNPFFDVPYQKPSLNQGLVLDPELQRRIAEEAASERMHQNHKRKDWMKAYMDECVKFRSITKGK